jgi:hypothetical protein
MTQATGERNYHAFYFMLAGRNSIGDELNETLELGQGVGDYRLLNQNRTLESNIVEGIDDCDEFDILVEALHALHVTQAEQDGIFRWVGAGQTRPPARLQMPSAALRRKLAHKLPRLPRRAPPNLPFSLLPALATHTNPLPAAAGGSAPPPPPPPRSRSLLAAVLHLEGV